jgi:hypothetical protein
MHNQNKYIFVFLHTMQSQLARSWYPMQREMTKLHRRGKLTLQEFKRFSMHIVATDVNEVISGYDVRTFPKTRNWTDKKRFLYHRRGMYVFDFRGKHGELPDDRIVLTHTIGRKRLTLTCDVDSAFLNTTAVLDDAVALQNPERHTSKVCGRCALKLVRYEFTDHKRNIKSSDGPVAAKRHRLLTDF